MPSREPRSELVGDLRSMAHAYGARFRAGDPPAPHSIRILLYEAIDAIEYHRARAFRFLLGQIVCIAIVGALAGVAIAAIARGCP